MSPFTHLMRDMMITQKLIISDVDSNYSKLEEKAAAKTAYELGLEWVNSQPKTWCMSEDRKSRRDARRQDRQKKKQQQTEMYDYIHSRMANQQTVTADGVQVVGFGFIIMAILSGIISWVVQRILNHYWEEENK